MVKEYKHVDGSSGVSPLGPSGKVKAAIRKAAKSIHAAPTMEIERLRRLCRSKFGIASENLLFANSLKELIYFVVDVLSPENVLMAGPAPVMYEDSARSAGAEVSCISLLGTDYSGFDNSRMRDGISTHDLILLSSPNRITGKMFPWEEIRKIVMGMADESPHFVIDGALMEFTGELVVDYELVQTGKITFLGTTALFYGIPGLELAYAVSSPEMIHLYGEKKHWELNLLSIEAARAAYKDSSYIKNLHKFIDSEKKMIIRLLRKIEGIEIYDTDTNVFLVKTSNDPDETARKLKRAGLDIRNCGGIKGLDNSFFSISVMKHEDNLKLISSFKK